jgi:hypothetical protein
LRFYCLLGTSLVVATAAALASPAEADAAGTSSSSAAPAVIVPTGPAQEVFRWSTMHCETWDIPDTAARAWRDAGGAVHLLASHMVNRAMVGPDLDHVRQDCRVLYQGGGRDEPKLYDDRSWLASPYTLDGTTVFSLIHNEFQGNLRPALCPSRDYARCWRNSLTLAVSHDGGLSFAHEAAPAQLVAALPYRYGGDIGHRSGYFNPSNILAQGGFYYAFFWAEAEGAQRRGACLMRTADLADPKSWRAWDGQGFTISFADPYGDPSIDAAAHVCTPVGEGKLTSVVSSMTRRRGHGEVIALMATERPPEPGKAPVTGIFASVSDDLLHWSEPTLLWQAELLYKFSCGASDPVFYPALLDPASPSRNFEDIGERGFIYLTDIHLESCRIGVDRDLVRIPVEIAG